MKAKKKYAPRKPKQLEPLIPLDDLRDVVRGLVAVPKARVVPPAKPAARKRAAKKKPR